MRTMIAGLGVGLLMLGGVGVVTAADLKDKVKVETDSVGLHPGMDPGMYVCALNHLHIKGTVQNLASVAVGPVKVLGKAFDSEGKVLGTAIAATKQTTLQPNERAEINLEFLTVIGPSAKAVKKHEITVIEAPAKQ